MLTGTQVDELWQEYFRAQSSCEGPKSPSVLLEEITCPPDLAIGTPFAAGSDVEAASSGTLVSDSDTCDGMSLSASSDCSGGLDVPEGVGAEGGRSCEGLVRSVSAVTRSATSCLPDEFDDDHLASINNRLHELRASAKRSVTTKPSCPFFTFSELCEAQATINDNAALAPHDGAPLQVYLSRSENLRVFLLNLLNVCFRHHVLPMAWLLVALLPVPKPGKDPSSLNGYRQVTLMGGGLKLYDKLLFLRVKDRICASVSPWQGGSLLGADEMVWILREITDIRAGLSKRTFAGFVDGECAFCRPPPAVPLIELWELGIQDYEWLSIDSMLGRLQGYLKSCGVGSRRWRIECGVPQGGALSSHLFSLALRELPQLLLNAGCGVDLCDGSGTVIRVPCLAYVDDIVVLSDSAEGLQRGLDVVYAWSRRIRMRLNVGADKSAVMIFGKGPLSHDDKFFSFALGPRHVPVVSAYKYCGHVLSCGGSSSAQLHKVHEKVVKRTGEIVAWARSYEVSLDVVDRMWRLHVQSGAFFSVGVLCLPPSALCKIDRSQRKAARMLAGFSSRSPTPGVLLEVGWTTWSLLIEDQVCRLFGRLMLRKNVLVEAVLHCASTCETRWILQAQNIFKRFALTFFPRCKPLWIKLASDIRAENAAICFEDLCESAKEHTRLAHFLVPARARINRLLHDKAVPAYEARIVARALCGGQGFRAGDPRDTPSPSELNCCIFCLSQGVRVAETLEHVVLSCGGYDELRSSLHLRLGRSPSLFELTAHSRDVWSFSELKSVRRFFVDIDHARSRHHRVLGGCSKKSICAYVQSEWA